MNLNPTSLETFEKACSRVVIKGIALETGILIMLLFSITFLASKGGPGGTNFGKTL